jgi:hypothetical protein
MSLEEARRVHEALGEAVKALEEEDEMERARR